MIQKLDMRTIVILQFLRAAKRRRTVIRERLLVDKIARDGYLEMRLRHYKWEMEQYRQNLNTI